MERSSVFAVTKSYFMHTVAYILVYDKGDLDTLIKLNHSYQRATRESITTSHLIFSLWGNCTENNINPVDCDTVMDYAPSVDVPSDLIFEVNARSGWNVDESYQRVIEAVHRAQTQSPSSKPWTSPSGFLTSFASVAREKLRQSWQPSQTVTLSHRQFSPSSEAEDQVHMNQSSIVLSKEETGHRRSRGCGMHC